MAKVMERLTNAITVAAIDLLLGASKQLALLLKKNKNKNVCSSEWKQVHFLLLQKGLLL